MKYMLLIYSDEKIWTDESREACMAESLELCHELEREGKYLASSPLHFVDTAVSVRVREGKTLTTDGPFAETHEQLGGYYIIDAADMEEAKAIAARIPPATVGTVEIRPIFELEGLPEERETQNVNCEKEPAVRDC